MPRRTIRRQPSRTRILVVSWLCVAVAAFLHFNVCSWHLLDGSHSAFERLEMVAISFVCCIREMDSGGAMIFAIAPRLATPEHHFSAFLVGIVAPITLLLCGAYTAGQARALSRIAPRAESRQRASVEDAELLAESARLQHRAALLLVVVVASIAISFGLVIAVLSSSPSTPVIAMDRPVAPPTEVARTVEAPEPEKPVKAHRQDNDEEWMRDWLRHEIVTNPEMARQFEDFARSRQ